MNTEICSFLGGFPIEAVLKMPCGRYELSLTTMGNHPEILIYDNETNEAVSEEYPADLTGLKQAIAKLELLFDADTLIVNEES